MRKEAREQNRVQVTGVQGYHQRSDYSNGREAYAFQGFSGNWYFNSDRKIKLDENFRRADGQPLQGFGLEIETECRGTMRQAMLAECLTKVVFPYFKFGADMFKLQEDGSLGGDSSAEIITQIMTKSRIRNDYASYKTMFNDYFPAFGISADSFNTSCGMHVNVSNALFGKTEDMQIEAIRKLYYIVNKHYDVMVRAFYRCPSRTGWSGRMTREHMCAVGVPAGQAEEFDYNNSRNWDIDRAPASHRCCMNLSHFRAGRIEIRLVGGQKDYYTFRNTMETVFHLVERVRSISWDDCDDIAAVFKGCNQYVYKRLSTECRGLIGPDALAIIRANVKEENLELN